MRPILESATDYENFQSERVTVGNSLGNYRWLDVSANRARQENQIEDVAGEIPFVKDLPKWNELLEKKRWSQEDVQIFQEMIDLRSLAIYEALLKDGGLREFVTAPDCPQHLQSKSDGQD